VIVLLDFRFAPSVQIPTVAATELFHPNPSWRVATEFWIRCQRRLHDVRSILTILTLRRMQKELSFTAFERFFHGFNELSVAV
jgi:hypothetical protein